MVYGPQQGPSFNDHDVIHWDPFDNGNETYWQRFKGLFGSEKQRKAIEGLESDHRIAIRKQDFRHQEEINRLRGTHQNELRAKDHELRLQEDFYNQQLGEAESRFTGMESNLHNQIHHWKVAHHNEQKRSRAELEREQIQHHEETTQLVQRQTNKEAEMTRKFNELVKLRTDEVSKLNSVLMNTDTEAFVAPLLAFPEAKEEPDEHIKNYFSELVQLVDALSRLEWKETQPVWTEAFLQRTAPDTNRRILKKHILKDMIWTLLDRHIFCSPFRVFGNEGLILEKQWNDRFGKDTRFNNGLYTWPEPSILAERWRYLTIRECRQILTESISEFDSRAKIKAGFMATVGSLITEIEARLLEIVRESDINIQTIEQLAKKMALRWLEFAMYRCRIVISMQGSGHGTAADKVRMAQEGFLSLTVVPSLKRHGNVKGTDLEKDSIVRGCAGESFKLS